MRRLVGDVHALIEDLPVRRTRLTEDRHQQGRLARAVGADEAHGFPFIDVQRDFLQGLDRPVKHVQFLEFEDGLGHTTSSSSAPR
ncbi:hypothetical protein D3C86_2087330 [compost metagenome]